MPRSRTRVLVVGDVMVDEYVHGVVRRTSPEAPGVPVLEVGGRELRLGGAANVAHNVVHLGGEAEVVGVRGKDAAGSELAALLRKGGIRDSLLAISGRKTTAKARVLDGTRQLVRVDEEETGKLSAADTAKLVARIKKSSADIVIISDYAKGVLSEELVRAVVAKFGATRVVAGIKPKNARLARGLRLVAANRTEAEAVLGKTGTGRELAEALAKKLGSPVAVTLGKSGSVVCESGHAKLVRPHRVTQVDVSGAGDTYVTAAALGLARGLSLPDAAEEANVAAALAVAKHGTSAVTRREVERALRQ